MNRRTALIRHDPPAYRARFPEMHCHSRVSARHRDAGACFSCWLRKPRHETCFCNGADLSPSDLSMNITSATLAPYVAYSTTNSTKRQTVAASAAAEGQTVAYPSISQAAQDALQASLAAGSSSSTPSSSIPFMQILQTENSLNPNPTAAQSASASAYASDPSADPQFLAVSGTTPFNMPSSTPGEQQLIGNPMSGATIAGIEKQLGVIALSITQIFSTPSRIARR